MSSLAGTGALVRLGMRRDRLILPVWLYGLVAVMVGTAESFERLYPTVAGRRAFAAGVADDPALTSLYGHLLNPTSLGSITMWRIGVNAAAFAGVMGVMTLVRHTRAEEETGRLELLGAGVVGRHAPLAAALVLTLGAEVAIGVAVAAGMMILGLGVTGSIAAGLALATTGCLFAAVGAVAAQLTESARAANALGLGLLALAVGLRATGDGGGGLAWLSWVSPAAWPEQLHAFAGERWWVLLLPAGGTAILLGVTAALVGRRDLGAGLLPTRPGPARAAPGLRSPLALAWRLQRGLLAVWVASFVILGVVFGSLAVGIGDLLKSSSQLVEGVTRLGGGQAGLADTYIAAVMGICGSGAAAYALLAALRLRSEEAAQRAEPLLATAVSRTRLMASHLTIALGGSALVLVVAGAGAGIADGARSHDAGQLPRVLGAALAQLPATWVLAGIAVAVVGLVPRWAVASWGVLAAFILLGQVGAIFQLSPTVMDLSPFAHTPHLPGGTFSVAPLAGLCAVAAVLIAAGIGGFRRRDIG